MSTKEKENSMTAIYRKMRRICSFAFIPDHASVKR